MFNRTWWLGAAFPQFVEQPKQSVSLHTRGTGCGFSGMNEQQVPVSHLPLTEAAKGTAALPQIQASLDPVIQPTWILRYVCQALSQPTHESDLLLLGITWPLFTDSPPPAVEVPVKTGVPAAPRGTPVCPATLSGTSTSAVCLFFPLSRSLFPESVSFLYTSGNVSRLPRVFWRGSRHANGAHPRKTPDHA